MKKPVFLLLAAALALMASLVAPIHAGASTLVEDNPYQRGDAPTVESLEALGPFEYASFTRTAAQTGPGLSTATIYHPVNQEGTFGAVAIVPGFTATQTSIAWYGPLLASHGYVAMTINTTGFLGLDQPPARAAQLNLALDYLSSDDNPVRQLVDPDRLAVMGHSMGGGGAIQATSIRPSIKASVALTPWHGTKNWPNVVTPTLILGAEFDTVATVAAHARPLYAGLSDDIAKSYPELRGAGHSVPTSGFNPTVAKLTISWLKRFVDDDYRYDPFLCPPSDDTDTYSEYFSTCDYTPDSDGDGVSDPYDHCPDTTLPDVLDPLPNPRAGAARADRITAHADGRFLTGAGIDTGITMWDTGGCSALQIIDRLELGEAHRVFGITQENLDEWLGNFADAP